MNANHAEMTKGSYRRLGIELAVDFVVMYLVMYTMIATLDDFYPNLNTAYMTLMMVTPMAIVMLIAMRSMFPSPRINVSARRGRGNDLRCQLSRHPAPGRRRR